LVASLAVYSCKNFLKRKFYKPDIVYAFIPPWLRSADHKPNVHFRIFFAVSYHIIYLCLFSSSSSLDDEMSKNCEFVDINIIMKITRFRSCQLCCYLDRGLRIPIVKPAYILSVMF
jgi:hypothetical protein